MLKIALKEIWTFYDHYKDLFARQQIELVAGDLVIPNISAEDIVAIQSDSSYDTELLPAIFTFREVLWQPNVYPDAKMILPAMRILKSFCEEQSAVFSENKSVTGGLYASLLQGLAQAASLAEADLQRTETSASQVLGIFRIAAFPIVKFFIDHPMNRPDHYQDAVNRLNYAVEVMLTQLHGRYTALEDPYWKIYTPGKEIHVASPDEKSEKM